MRGDVARPGEDDCLRERVVVVVVVVEVVVVVVVIVVVLLVVVVVMVLVVEVFVVVVVAVVISSYTHVYFCKHMRYKTCYIYMRLRLNRQAERRDEL